MTDHRTLREQVAELVDRLELSDCADARHCLCVTIAIKRLREALLAAPTPSLCACGHEPRLHNREGVCMVVMCEGSCGEAPAVAPPATPPEEMCRSCDLPHPLGRPCAFCSDCAAEPPAPSAQVLTPEQVNEAEARLCALALVKGYPPDKRQVQSLVKSHEALRAEVARLQEELKQAQITLLLGRGRADELSSLMKLIVSWTEADAYGHRNDSGAGNWQSRAEKARRAAELLESTLHLRDVAEAEAQALRAGLTEAMSIIDDLDNLDMVSLTDATQGDVARLRVLLSPAQE